MSAHLRPVATVPGSLHGSRKHVPSRPGQAAELHSHGQGGRGRKRSRDHQAREGGALCGPQRHSVQHHGAVATGDLSHH